MAIETHQVNSCTAQLMSEYRWLHVAGKVGTIHRISEICCVVRISVVDSNIYYIYDYNYVFKDQLANTEFSLKWIKGRCGYTHVLVAVNWKCTGHWRKYYTEKNLSSNYYHYDSTQGPQYNASIVMLKH